jgi:hypothetical protein
MRITCSTYIVTDPKRSQMCRFKTQAPDSVTIYSPNDIKGYRFTDGRYYVSAKLPEENQSVFIECLVEGYLSAFLYTDTIGNHFYISHANEKLIAVPFKQGLQYIDNTSYHVPGQNEGWYNTRSTTHIPLLLKQMSDVPQLTIRIKKTRVIERQGMVDLVKDSELLTSPKAR